MDRNANLRTSTEKYFESINFSELNDAWIEGVVDNEFTDAEENPITTSILFVNDPKQTLSKLADVCDGWCQKPSSEESNVINDSVAAAEEALWTVLDEMEINIKQIQGLIYLLCHTAAKNTACTNDKSLGLASARLYFSLLKVPGSAAYSVFHSNLFKLCIDCLPAPDFTTDKDSSSLREFENLSILYVSTLLSLIPLLRDFHLGDDPSALEHAIKKLSELAACEVQSHVKFNINFLEIGERELRRRYKPTFIATALAYQAFSAILDTDLNGNKDRNYLVILSYLNKHILCFKARKSQTISQKHLVVKDNAVNYLCYNLKMKDFCWEATQIAIKRLCLAVTDKSEIRNSVSASIVCILFHMQAEHLTEMIDWILLFIDSADTKDRVFALEVLGHLLSSTEGETGAVVPDSFKDDTFRIPIIFAILTRCDDVSPAVRTKALTVLSQNMKCILNFLDRTKDQKTFEVDESDEGCEKDLDINGNHRFFWYNLTSFRERLNEIAAILQRRIEDNNVTARKAALLALENLIIFDQTYITEENLKFFSSTVKDGNIVVRKQVMQCLSNILEAYRENVDIQESWIKCILPLVHDPETTVQGKALSILEEQFLQKIFSSSQADRECAFTLLRLLSSGDFLAHHRYLKKCFSSWKAENKLRPQTVIQLEKYLGTEWEECIWFYLSNFALYSSLPLKVSNLCIDQFQNYKDSETYPHFMQYLLKVVMHTLKSLSLEKSEIVRNVVTESLQSFSVPVELMPLYIEILYKICKHRNAETEFAEFSSSVIQKCEESLAEVQVAPTFPESPSEELLAKYFCSIKEFCQLCAANITPSVISVLKTFSACEPPSKALSKILSPSLKAHVFSALGKICLQHEILAKEMLPVYAKELFTSKYDVIRSNIVIILIEMCKRYTSFADKYVPLIISCFKDKLYLIRYQTIVLVVNLLQEGYLKWRGVLFFSLLSTLVDKKDAIQELGRYSLGLLLQEKKKNLFSEHFIDSIFVFNNYPPPDNESVAQTVKELERFSLAGEDMREERMCLYRFLLESLELKDKAYLVKSLCDIITSVAESVYPLNQVTECIVRDCFAIFTSKEIRCFTIEQFGNIDEAKIDEYSKAELDTRRVVLVDPIIPVIVGLKNSATDPESDLMQDIILFLKELLHDFRDSLKDILAVDKVLLGQLELEIKNESERERAEKRVDKELKEKNKQTINGRPEKESQQPVTIEGIQSMIQDVSRIMEQGAEGEDAQNDANAASPQTPRISHVRKLQRSSHRAGPSTSRAGTTAENLDQQMNNVEVADMQRLQSTPRIVLTPVKVPLTTNILNISAVETVNEPMNIEDSDEEIL